MGRRSHRAARADSGLAVRSPGAGRPIARGRTAIPGGGQPHPGASRPPSGLGLARAAGVRGVGDRRGLPDLLEYVEPLVASDEALGLREDVTRHDEEAARVAPHLLVLLDGGGDGLLAVAVAALADEVDQLRRLPQLAQARLEPLVDPPEARLVLDDPPLAPVDVHDAHGSAGAPTALTARSAMSSRCAPRWSSTARRATAATTSSAEAPAWAPSVARSSRSPRSRSVVRTSVTPSV